MDFQETIRRTCGAITADGRVTLGETAILMRMVRPFAQQGDANAVALEKLLREVREDGVITAPESTIICERLLALADEKSSVPAARKIMTMPSATGRGAILIEKILDAELGDKCGLYARVTIPTGAALGYHEHHGNGESYFILSGEGLYDDNGEAKRVVRAGDSTWTPDGHGHGLDNSNGREDLVFMALIVNN